VEKSSSTATPVNNSYRAPPWVVRTLARRVFHACCGFSFAIGSAKENGPGKTPGRFREEVLQQRTIKNNKEMKFTALLHHLTVDLLRESRPLLVRPFS